MKEIKIASEEDLEEILELQHIAYKSEAETLGNHGIPQIRQTLSDMEADYRKGIILKLVENEKIIGSVRGYVFGNTAHIEKLIVLPEYRKRGNGTMLLREIEKYFDADRYELFTGSFSDNIRIYERNGYVRFKEEKITSVLTLVYLEKKSENTDDFIYYDEEN